MPVDAAAWYDPEPDLKSRYQGDVLDGIPVVLMPPHGEGPWIALRPSPPITIAEAKAGRTPRAFKPHPDGSQSDPWAGGTELVLAKARKTTVMVVTQTCDLDNRKHVQVAPVFEINKLDSTEKQQSLRFGEIGYLFYLPSRRPRLSKESFADLSQITTIHKSYIKDAVLVERMTARATLELQNYLASLHGRPFGFNVKDKVPQTAVYACVNCFLNLGVYQQQVLTEGKPCQPCDACGDKALWIKLREAS